MKCEQVQRLLEAYIDGDLSADQHEALQSHLEACATCRREAVLASKVVDTLRALPEVPCPDYVVFAALQRMRARRRIDWRRILGLLARPITVPRWRPIAGLALAVIIAAIVIVSQVTRKPARVEQFTAEDIRRGRTQVEWTLGYLDRVFQRTAITVRKDVLDERVAASMRWALKEAFKRIEVESAGGTHR